MSQAINWIKQNCEEFVKNVCNQMWKEGWKWADPNHPDSAPSLPTPREVKATLFELLSDIEDGKNDTSIGGIRVLKNGNHIECYFGHNVIRKEGITLFSPDTEEYEDPVLDFIDKMCKECPILNRDYLIDTYYHKKDS